MSGQLADSSLGNVLNKSSEQGSIYLHGLVVSLISTVLFISKLNSLFVLTFIFCILMSTKLTEYLINTKKVVFGNTMKKILDSKLKEAESFFSKIISSKSNKSETV